jgi:CelD/BcsL family acetyltransferase involved in cellulose biosynthesis
MNAQRAHVGNNSIAFVAPSDGAAVDGVVSHAEFSCWRRAVADAKFRENWDRLALVAHEPNAFTERWYLQAALEALDADNLVKLVAIWSGRRLVGLMPVDARGGYARLPVRTTQNWLNHNAFLGTPLVAPGFERQFWRAIFKLLDENMPWSLFAHFTGIAIDGTVAGALEAECLASGRRHAIVHSEERALLERGLSPAEYLETTVRGKKRKELRRQQNRLAEEGELAFTRGHGAEGLDEWIDDFLALERSGWKGANGSALDCADGTRGLFRGALQGAAAAGKLELLDLRLDGRAIAMLVNFLTPPGAFSFKTAFDEDYARFSPGVLLQIENLALLEHDYIDWCDSCAAQDHPMIDSLWSGRRTIGRYSVAIGGRTKRAAFAALLAAEKAKARLKGRTIA